MPATIDDVSALETIQELASEWLSKKAPKKE